MNRIAGVCIPFPGSFVIALHHLTGIPTFSVIKWRYHLQILEKSESCLYRDVMLHCILPFPETGFKQTVVFCLQAVGQTSRITQWDLFVPTLLTYRTFTLKRENSTQSNIQVRQGDSNRRVTHGLRYVESTRECQLLIRETTRVAYTRSFCILGHQLRIIEVVDIGTFVTTGSEVYTCRESAVGTRLLVLPVIPHNLEVFSNRIVRHTFIPKFGYLIAGL